MPEEDNRTAADDRARRRMMAWLRRGRDRPTLMDRYLPTYDIRIGQHTLVRATPADIYAAMQRLDALISDDPLVRALSAVRLVPLRLARLLRRRSRGARWPATAPAAAAAAAPPFVPLAQKPGAEIVLGLIGQFWTKGFGYQRVAPRAFAAFNRPGFAKVALNLAAYAQRDGRSLLTSETRVATTDVAAGRRFRRYWRVIGPGAGLLMRRLLALIKADAEQAAHRRSAAAAVPPEARSSRWTSYMM